MRSTRKENRLGEDIEIDLAPMIDCIFILLIFFIVTSVFIDTPGIEVEKPNVSGSDISDRNVLLIAITPQNKVFFDGREIRPDQIAIQLKQSIVDEEAPLIIQADRRCSHGVFSSVYSEARKAGIKHIQFATQTAEPF